MAKLETDIKQIFLTRPENKTSSQILYDEAISDTNHLFFVAEIRNISRKTEVSDLKKISEIVLDVFRKNNKLPAETLFESSLSEINQGLAEFAHKGHRSWLNKFSAGILLKSQQKIYLANSGSVVAFLIRNRDLSPIVEVEKPSSNLLKTFQNFAAGQIRENDILVLALHNIFDYISLELFAKTIQDGLDEGIKTFSKILHSSTDTEQFSCFLLSFNKKIEAATEPSEIFAPLPEEEKSAQVMPVRPIRSINLTKLFPANFSNLSPARKFFLVSFAVFVLIFALNLIALGVRHGNKKNQEKVNQQISKLSEIIHDAEASLIYKNDEQAFKLLNDAWQKFGNLEKQAPKQALEIKPVMDELDNRINRISIVSSPTPVTELKFPPSFAIRAGQGFLFAGANAKNLVFYDQQVRDIFLINNPADELRGVTHADGIGHVLATGNKIYLVNEAAKQVELLKSLANANIQTVQFAPPNRLYVADKNKNQILRLNFSGKTLSEPQPVLKGSISLSDLVDFGLDRDFYLLSPSTITKVVGGQAQSFKLSAISQPISSAKKLLVAANLYLLEPQKKRVLIFNKQGQILNQIVLPNSSELLSFAVNEQQRNLYLVDGNKLYRITF